MLLLCLLGIGVLPLPASDTSEADSAQFLSAVKTLCGRRFPGQILADYPPPKADDPFTGKHSRYTDVIAAKMKYESYSRWVRIGVVLGSSRGFRPGFA